MTLEQFLNLVATIFGAIGSVYVLKSILRLTPVDSTGKCNFEGC